MDHKAIRLRILFVLYYYYFSGSPDKPISIKKVLEDSGLGFLDQDINGDIIYLYNKGYILGQFYTGSDIPALVRISTSGIDLMEESLEKFFRYLDQKNAPSKDENTVKDRLTNLNSEEKLKELFSIFKIYPGLFDNFARGVA